MARTLRSIAKDNGMSPQAMYEANPELVRKYGWDNEIPMAYNVNVARPPQQRTSVEREINRTGADAPAADAPPVDLSGYARSGATTERPFGSGPRTDIDPMLEQQEGMQPSSDPDSPDVYYTILDESKLGKGVYPLVDVDNLNELNPFRCDIHEDHLITGYGYVFLTTPDLNLIPYNDNGYDSAASVKYNLSANSFLAQVEKTFGNKLFQKLSFRGTFDPFIYIITNKAKSFDLRDTTLRTSEDYSTVQGLKMNIPLTSMDSVGSGEFSINYTDDSDLTVFNLHKIWVDYVDGVRRGDLVPNMNNAKNNIIDYMSSLYYFLLKPDGRTITYWAKYTGVVPTSVPHSALGYKQGIETNIDFSVNYIYSYKEEMGVDILHDFNKVAAMESLEPETVGTKKGTNDKMPAWVDMKMIDQTIGSRKKQAYVLNFRKGAAERFERTAKNPFSTNYDIKTAETDYSGRARPR